MFKKEAIGIYCTKIFGVQVVVSLRGIFEHSDFHYVKRSSLDMERIVCRYRFIFLEIMSFFPLKIFSSHAKLFVIRRLQFHFSHAEKVVSPWFVISTGFVIKINLICKKLTKFQPDL